MTRAYTCLAIGFALGCCADFFFCRWGKEEGKPVDFVFGLALYTADTALWAMSVRYGLPFWRAGILWTLGSLVFCVLVGMLFRERPNVLNWVGIGLAVVAAILIEV